MDNQTRDSVIGVMEEVWTKGHKQGLYEGLRSAERIALWLRSLLECEQPPRLEQVNQWAQGELAKLQRMLDS